MTTGQYTGQERAVQPEDLARLFFTRANAGDVDGLVALFESAAVSVLPNGEIATGRSAIGESFEELVTAGVAFTPVLDQPALRAGDLALTSRRLANGEVPVEVARRQPQGDWLWVVDQPNILR
ncbi:hypothetical protein G1H10_29020 [Phytoactinopolyspora halotolerans]|uniref:SnoaL-like domain-containing protein n=1 Tax=Phytoactinopolyspora halotolerans TaxID=1981512 RepID=A0A6L9SGG2_9ACTN|nr:hypothetical protein [Phytoactinopolyspora halotolerans]